MIDETGELAGRVAVVTGAGRGIGAAIARRLGEAGATVIVTDVSPKSAEDFADELRADGIVAAAYSLDVTRRADCRRVVAAILRGHGRLDLLVNNAGIATYGSVTEISTSVWNQQIGVVATGTFLMTQAVAPMMIRAGAGSMLNIASVGGMGGWPLRGAYDAAKAAVINFTATMAGELGPHGVRVNSISPGTILTPMAMQAEAEGVASLDRYALRTPAGRLGKPEEVAGTALFLLSDRARFITGINVRVDGGWVAWANSNGAGFRPEAGSK